MDKEEAFRLLLFDSCSRINYENTSRQPCNPDRQGTSSMELRLKRCRDAVYAVACLFPVQPLALAGVPAPILERHPDNGGDFDWFAGSLEDCDSR